MTQRCHDETKRKRPTAGSNSDGKKNKVGKKKLEHLPPTLFSARSLKITHSNGNEKEAQAEFDLRSASRSALKLPTARPPSIFAFSLQQARSPSNSKMEARGLPDGEFRCDASTHGVELDKRARPCKTYTNSLERVGFSA